MKALTDYYRHQRMKFIAYVILVIADMVFIGWLMVTFSPWFALLILGLPNLDRILPIKEDKE